MNKKRFERNVLNALPELGVSGGYFFFHPVCHIISGFSIEFTPTFRYIWKYCLPLFEPWDFLNFSFAERIEKAGLVSGIGMDEIALAKYFLNTIRPYFGEIRKLGNIPEFIDRFTNDDFKTNGHTFRAMAVANILVGNISTAKEYLLNILSESSLCMSDDFLLDTRNILYDIEKNESAVPRIVLYWEQETKQRFQIY